MQRTHLFYIFFLSLPYFGQFWEKLCSELVVLLGRHFSDARFNVVLVNKFTVGSFFNYKNKLPMHLKLSLLYKFSSAQCASEYVGMTTRTLGTGVDEHVGVSYRTGARLIRQYVIIEIVVALYLTPVILKYYQMPPELLI